MFSIFIGKLLWPKTKRHEINALFTKRMCTLTESSLTPDYTDSAKSSDVPSWLRNGQNPNASDPKSDDFVVPSLPKWVEGSDLITHKPVFQNLMIFGKEPEDKDVDRVSAVLTKHYTSVDKVVQVLNQCGVNATNDLVLQLLKRFSNSWVPAFGVFIWAKNQKGYAHTLELYDFVVDILGKRKKFSFMWELIEEMNLNGYVSLVTMSKVMRRLARGGKYEEAIDAFRGIEKFGVCRDTKALNVLMHALVKEGCLEHAHSMFLEFKDSFPLDSRSFNVLIHGFCKVRKSDDARRIMEEKQMRGFSADVVSFTCLVEAYCKEKDFVNVNAILDEMEEKGCSPNVITYTIVMIAFGKAKQMNEALEVYEKVKRNGYVPDAQFYSSFIYMLSQSGRIKDAWDVFEDMDKLGVSPDLCTFNTMISSACAHSKEEGALNLLRRMGQESCKPDIRTYAPLLKMCCRKKNMKMLKLLLNHMFRNDVSIELGTYSLLVKGLCKSGKLQHACFYFQESVLKGMIPGDSMYKMLVNELEGKSKVELKTKIVKLMLRAKEKIV